MSEGRPKVRGWMLVAALVIHVAAGLVGAVWMWVRGGNANPFVDSEPYPLQRWTTEALLAWVAVGVAVVLLARWPSSRRPSSVRFAVPVAALVLPVAALVVWLVVVEVVGPYPVTLRGELSGAVLTTTATVLEPGPQSLAIRNATRSHQDIGLLYSERPLTDAALSHGSFPTGANGTRWIPLEPIVCFLGCSSPVLRLEPGEEARHAVDLKAGYYALVCARNFMGAASVEVRCRPARFTVGSGATGPHGQATPAG